MKKKLQRLKKTNKVDEGCTFHEIMKVMREL